MSSKPDYSKDLFKQLEEVYMKLDKIEEKHFQQIQSIENMCNAKIDKLTNELRKSKEELAAANEKIESLESENALLRDDNERMKRILNNDSDNSSLPPSSDGTGKPANTYNSRKKTGKKQGAQKGHKGNNLSKEDIEKKIAEGKITCNEVIIGNPSSKFITRYRLNLEITSKATKYIIYPELFTEQKIAPKNTLG